MDSSAETLHKDRSHRKAQLAADAADAADTADTAATADGIHNKIMQRRDEKRAKLAEGSKKKSKKNNEK